MRPFCVALLLAVAVSVGRAGAVEFRLLTGVDPGLYPGAARSVMSSSGQGIPRDFYDGDRLAGTSNVGPSIVFQGSGTPMFPPNYLGAFSMIFRRGFVGFVNQPLMGIDFLGGNLLDLDGDLDNGARSLIPVIDQQTFEQVPPVEIPNAFSFIDLSFEFAGGTVHLDGFDATGTNEGSLNLDAGFATVLVTLAGTTPTGGNDGKINPGFDTRVGALAEFAGGGTLAGVYSISDLRVELWYDSISANTSSPNELGSFQHFNTFRGWLVQRDCDTDQFPTLSDQGLGTTLWPAVDTSEIGNTFNTAVTLFGPTATIAAGVPASGPPFIDDYTAPGNGGLALTDAGGDVGAYFDNVVIPLLDPSATAFVYLEAAGFGTNNTGDPVYTDTVGYDMVVIAQALTSPAAVGDVNGDGLVNEADADALVTVLLDPGAASNCELNRADVNTDGDANGLDVQALLDAML